MGVVVGGRMSLACLFLAPQPSTTPVMSSISAPSPSGAESETARHTGREGMWRSRERMACDDRCGDGTNAAAGQEGQRGSNSQEPGRKARNDYPLKPSKSK